jgi:hypothetical protein
MQRMQTSEKTWATVRSLTPECGECEGRSPHILLVLILLVIFRANMGHLHALLHELN